MRFLLLLVAVGFAPDPEPPVPVSPVGVWSMTWRGNEAPASFKSGGTYTCDWVDGRTWQGTWRLDALELTVTEAPSAEESPVFITWTIALTPGTLSGSDFALRRPRP